MENLRDKYAIEEKKPFKVNIKDPNFDRPLTELTTVYSEPARPVPPAPDYGDFQIIDAVKPVIQ